MLRVGADELPEIQPDKLQTLKGEAFLRSVVISPLNYLVLIGV